ncbi:PR domain zinc finger protein 4-like isoform X6 [Patiria miniata]|uniref:PR domain zinc finger protein 10 n=1 Tax=Patiria miniata TaxID=46514 RepID=A0A914A037_PATMI|nr:PR domain zinc finger protein 4-like isoform X6 [Patiria miniata]
MTYMTHNTDMLIAGCEDCGQSHLGDCPIHGPLLKVRDKSIPTRARLTLPHYLMLKDLELHTANEQVVGVFARKLIQQRTQFGPFIAPRVPKLETLRLDNAPIYKVFRNGIEVSTLDLSNENACSWMMFVRLATTFDEQNLVAYQFNEDIYFATCKPVAPHAELRVWYASDYAHTMNVTLLCANKPDGSAKTETSLIQSTDEQNQFDVKETLQELHEKDKNNNSACASSCEPWKCSNCSKVFGTFSLLEVHSCESKIKRAKPCQQQNVRTSQNRCTYCGKMYNTKPGFKKHMALHAAASGELTCKICNKDFENTHNLLEHIKFHSGKSSGTKEKKHQCEHCDRQFYTRKDVRRHMVVHTGRKDFLCQACGQRFGRKDHLVRHTRKSHDRSNNIRVKLDEQELATAKVQQALEIDQFQGQLHIPFTEEIPVHCSVGHFTPSSHRLTDLLKVPPVPPPTFSNKISRGFPSPAKQTVRVNARERMRIEPAVETESLNVKNISGESLCSESIDLGQGVGFLPIQHQTQSGTPYAMCPANVTQSPKTPPEHHQEITCKLHQHQLHQSPQSHFQQQTKLQRQHHPQQQLQMIHDVHPPLSSTQTSSISQTCSKVLQVPFLDMRSALPQFHQAFQ